ncbi:MAG: flagellar export protein FliJ [Ferrimonas sp.]
MADPKQLRRVLTQMTQQVELAQAALREAKATETLLHDQLQQLHQYRLDYLKQAQQQTGNTVAASHYQQFNYFINKLDHAITQHIYKQRQQQAKTKELADQFQKINQRYQALQLLIDKTEGQLLQKQAKREQQAMDEFATLQYVRRRS